MDDFETESAFHAVVDQASLREARSTVEDELGDIEVQVAAQTGSGGGGGNMAARDRALGRRLQDQQLDVLTDIQTSLDEQGLPEELGDNWDENLTLDTRRNELLEAILDSQEQDTFDRAKRAGGNFIGAGAMGAAVIGASAVGLISFLQDFEFDVPDIPPIEPPSEPDWIPISVDAPDSIPLEKPDWVPIPVGQPSGEGSGSGSGSGTGAPDDAPMDTPTPVPIGTPDPNPSPGSPTGPSPVPVPTGTGPVPDPSPTGDGGGGSPWPSPEEIAIGAGGAAGIMKGLEKLLPGGASGSASGVGFPSIAPILAEHGPDIFPGVPSPSSGSVAAIGAATGAAQQSTTPRTENNITVDNTSEITVEAGDLEELRRQQEQERQEIQRKIDELNRAIGGSGGGPRVNPGY